MMRFLCLLILLIAVGAVVIFAVENNRPTAVQWVNWSWTTSLAMVIGIAYLVGMMSGWTVLGVLRRSINRATEENR